MEEWIEWREVRVRAGQRPRPLKEDLLPVYYVYAGHAHEAWLHRDKPYVFNDNLRLVIPAHAPLVRDLFARPI